MTMATAFLRSNDGVCELAGRLARLLARGAGEWRRGASVLITLWRVQGARRARTGVCMGMPGRVWPRHVQASPGQGFVESRSGQGQESEKEWCDMAGQVGVER
jgi:hypothetical protein